LRLRRPEIRPGPFADRRRKPCTIPSHRMFATILHRASSRRYFRCIEHSQLLAASMDRARQPPPCIDRRIHSGKRDRNRSLAAPRQPCSAYWQECRKERRTSRPKSSLCALLSPVDHFNLNAPHLYQKGYLVATLSWDCTVCCNSVGLAPVLQFGPDLSERTEFRSAANENADPLFQRVGIIRRGADVLNVLKKLLEAIWAIVQNNHAIAGISARSPQKVGLIAA